MPCRPSAVDHLKYFEHAACGQKRVVGIKQPEMYPGAACNKCENSKPYSKRARNVNGPRPVRAPGSVRLYSIEHSKLEAALTSPVPL